MPLFKTAPQLMFRNLLYTGITRAKNLLVIVGDSSAIKYMVENNKKILRYSGLKEFLIS